jgi:hypothetical protein
MSAARSGKSEGERASPATNFGPVASVARLRCIDEMHKLFRKNRPRIRDEFNQLAQAAPPDQSRECRNAAKKQHEENVKFVERCVRRALEVAALSADMAKLDAEQANAISDWESLADRAGKASAKLGELLRWISPDIKKTDIKITKSILSRVLAQTRLGSEAPADIQTMAADAKNDAATILCAADILHALAEDAERRRAAFAASRQNPGEPAKRAFVLELARIWEFLTHEAPSPSPTGSFRDFVEAAWLDCVRPDQSEDEQLVDDYFTQSTRAARQTVNREREFLRQYGPDWL